MFESIAAFFLLPIVFWAYVILASIVFVASVENDKYIFAVLTTIVGVLVYHAPLMGILVNWPIILAVAVGYFLVGAIYSVYRWRKYCKTFIEEVPDHDEAYYLSRLAPGQHKSQLTGWVLLWPWSGLWNICGDVLTHIYESLKGVYERVAQAVIRKALGDALAAKRK